jgi:hypothetical protein
LYWSEHFNVFFGREIEKTCGKLGKWMRREQFWKERTTLRFHRANLLCVRASLKERYRMQIFCGILFTRTSLSKDLRKVSTKFIWTFHQIRTWKCLNILSSMSDEKLLKENFVKCVCMLFFFFFFFKLWIEARTIEQQKICNLFVVFLVFWKLWWKKWEYDNDGE